MNTKPTNTLKLRAHSIRNLTPSELRAANGGGCSYTSPNPTPFKTR